MSSKRNWSLRLRWVITAFAGTTGAGSLATAFALVSACATWSCGKSADGLFQESEGTSSGPGAGGASARDGLFDASGGGHALGDQASTLDGANGSAGTLGVPGSSGAGGHGGSQGTEGASGAAGLVHAEGGAAGPAGTDFGGSHDAGSLPGTGRGSDDVDGGQDAAPTCGVSGALAPDPPPSPAQTIIVDTTADTGCIKYGGIGWLYGLSEKQPIADDRLRGLVHPQFAGQMAPGGAQHPEGDALKVASQFGRVGGRGVSIYLQDYYAGFPYPLTPVDSFLVDVVDRVVAAVTTDANRALMLYVPLNNPDWIWYGAAGSKLTLFENDWKKIYDRIKAADPSARVAGPNFGAYTASAYDEFFKFCSVNQCLPDVTTWSDVLDGGVSHYSAVGSYRAIEKRYAISPREILVKEYGRASGDMGRPGRLIQYLARFERTKVYGSLAAWNTIGRLSDLLAPSGQPSGAWFLYQWYGSLVGHTLAVALPDKNGPLQAIAAKAPGGGVQVIFGGDETDDSVSTRTIVVSGLSGASATYEVAETNWAGVEKVPLEQDPPAVTMRGTVAVVAGSATVTIPGCQALSAYRLTVSPP